MLEKEWKWDYHFVMKMDFNYLYVFPELLSSLIRVNFTATGVKHETWMRLTIKLLFYEVRYTVSKMMFVILTRLLSARESGWSCALTKNKTLPRLHYNIY